MFDPFYGVTKEEWDRIPNQLDLDLWLSFTDGVVMAFGAAPTKCLRAILNLEPMVERIYVWWNTFTLTNSEGAFWQWQPIFTWRKDKVFGLEKDVIEMAANTGGDKLQHPTQKPVALMQKLIESCKDANTMLDLFNGVGTCMVACQNLGRRGRGIEISPAYCAVTLERMSQAFPALEIKRIENDAQN